MGCILGESLGCPDGFNEGTRDVKVLAGVSKYGVVSEIISAEEDASDSAAEAEESTVTAKDCVCARCTLEEEDVDDFVGTAWQ